MRETAKHAKKLARKTLNRLASQPKLVRLKSGQKIIVSGRMAFAFHDGQYNEANVEHWLRHLAKQLDRPVFYDIGANMGYYSIIMSSLTKKVYAFEPSRRTRQRLSLNLRLNKIGAQVEILPFGLSDKNNTAELNIYNSNGNNSLFERTIPKDHPLRFRRKETVRLMTLDSLVKQHKLLPPELIKIDIEGGELNALCGARRVIERHKPIILFEYSASTSRDAGYNREELIRVLRPHGYEFHGLAADPQDLTLYPMNQKSIPGIDNVVAVPKAKAVFLEIK